MKKYKITNKFKFFRFISICFVALCLMTLVLTSNLSYGNYENQEYSTEYYIVEPSDSLWKISTKFKPDNMSTRQFISIIKQYNRFIEGSSIKVGEHLNIPLINK
ncbi:LysM peptidoglycan-binding domain-containing protein [Finegoldia magna]|uniref:LysM domain protein n=1 Tax=Finegoldia magna ATCC 53516 TaxID=525282 RepID=D6SAL8_FINMA|nr:LysM peptidoglycan-binding domain-containing protein [Finegoldia magna]EFH92518.1 LysM domain protein [Finegoldia magna ATCC 53516]MDU1600392.1 LysM peptidoglycan-binding domain-containing protein [Finegoldia magna]